VRRGTDVSFQIAFDIANPSDYTRSDYVDVDLDRLGVPAGLGEPNLRLSRLERGGRWEVPFQVDPLYGEGGPERVLTFLAERTRPGSEEYRRRSATYLLEEGPPGAAPSPPDDLWVKYYHAGPRPGEPDDGCSDRWDRGRRVNGVKLTNGAVEVYVRAVPRLHLAEPVNLAGAVTSVDHRRSKAHTQADNILSPHHFAPGKGEARWGQVTKLVLYPLPWERRWYHTVHMLGPDRGYHLAYARRGPLRATAVLKSDPFSVRFNGEPYFRSEPVEIPCRLFRVFSVYHRVDGWNDPQAELYQEQLSVRAEDTGRTLAFRCYFSSFLPFDPGTPYELARLEHVPDFFTAWWHGCGYGQSWGYGFAADSHCRQVTCHEGSVAWRLQLSHIHNCVHQFLYHQPFEDPRFDPGQRGLHEVGHHGWYERVFKPIEVVPLYKYLPHDPEDEVVTA
jgi:hypothetical protein